LDDWDRYDVFEDQTVRFEIPDSHLEDMAVLFRYWEALPGDRRREDVNPLALGSELLPHVSLGALIDGCTDFRYDLISSEMKAVAPRLQPGARSSDSFRIQGTKVDLIHDLFMSTGHSIAPKVLRVFYASMEGMPRGIYTLFLPLGRQSAADGTPVASDLMIGLWRFEPTAQFKEDRYEDLSDAFEAYLAAHR